MSEPPSRLAAFVAELRRRRVFRVAVVHAGVAFIVFQVADFTFPALHVPDWFSSAVVVLLILGFPVVVGMAWAFDLTAEGLVRAKPEREPTAAKAPHHIVIGNKTLAIVAAVAVAVAVWSWLGRPSAAGPITSIAVLPLDNLGGDPEQVYFVEGMHEALITELAKLGALRVISRTSTLGFRDAVTPITEIAQALGVDAVVEGSVLVVGERVRINAQLIDGRREQHLWADAYERDLRDVLALHQEVALAIAKQVEVTLTSEDQARLASAPQVNPEAYNLYLKGWYFRNLESRESMPKAVEYLEQAVALDPDFVRAWAALAHSYLLMSMYGPWSRDYALDRMKPALDKALELDPNLPDAHAGLGLYQVIAQDDIVASEASFRRALELDPDNVYALHEYGWFLSRTGRPDEALAEYRRAQDLDPLNPTPLYGIGCVYLNTRQYDKAMEYWQAVLELAPDNSLAPIRRNRTKREILMQQGRYAEVAAGAEGAGFLLKLRAEWALENREKVYSVRDSLRSTGELQQREQEDPWWSSRLYAIMGERDKALSLLERAYEDTTIGTTGLVYNPEFDSLRAEPRFKALLKKLGLTEVFDQYGRRIR